MAEVATATAPQKSNITHIMKNLAILLFIGLFIHTLAFPQQTSSTRRGSLTSGTIDSQFIYLNQISRSQDDFKLIRRINLETVRKNVADSLRQLRTEIAASASTITGQQGQIATLADSLASTQEQLRVSEGNQDRVSLLGISLNKSSVSVLFVSIVSVLVLLLVFYIYRFNQSHVVTRDARKSYDDLQEEFETHRKKALEREQKLKRQLQDEINRRTG